MTQASSSSGSDAFDANHGHRGSVLECFGSQKRCLSQSVVALSRGRKNGHIGSSALAGIGASKDASAEAAAAEANAAIEAELANASKNKRVGAVTRISDANIYDLFESVE